MKIWSVSNQKGGVGKTTTVVTLGALLSSLGFKTLLLDLDPHGSLTSYFNMNPDEIQTSVYNLFQDFRQKKKNLNPEPYIVETEFEGLFVLPASTAIATLERQMSSMDGMGLVISYSLKEVSEKYDYVIIDSPPMLGVLMINALAACEHLLMPVSTEFLALKGLERMLHTLKIIYSSTKNKLSYTIVPTIFDKRTNASQESLGALRRGYTENVWQSVIPIDTKIREASQLGIPAPFSFPTTRAVKSYRELLEFLIEKIDPDHQKAIKRVLLAPEKEQSKIISAFSDRIGIKQQSRF